MTILDEIIAWSSKSLPLWQQDAVARIYQNGKLTPADYDDFLAMAKGAFGIADPEGRQPQPLTAKGVVAPQVPNRLVELVSIKGVTNVNALAQGAELPIARNGITVIYGENGAGKSGYSRILKRACRARDQNETILTDARKPQGTGGTPEATFSMIVDGHSSDLRWLFGQQGLRIKTRCNSIA